MSCWAKVYEEDLEKRRQRAGERMADALLLHPVPALRMPDPGSGKYQTLWGPKTAVGLADLCLTILKEEGLA